MDTEQVAKRLALWIRDKVKTAESKGVVLGMSGGLDSSVLAVLCQHAFPQNILGVLMPCHSNQEDEEYAQAVADKFSVPTKIVALDTTFDVLVAVTAINGTEPTTNRLAEANLKVRLRMPVLYYFANQLKYMVAGSSNRSELAIGYYTKYGDGGVDILPLGNLVKEQIRELANFLGIPQQIIDKPPSAGLWPGQTDEAELGFSYEELDHYLTNGEASNELRKKIEAMIKNSSHKRSLPPIANLPA